MEVGGRPVSEGAQWPGMRTVGLLISATLRSSASHPASRMRSPHCPTSIACTRGEDSQTITRGARVRTRARVW
jgi:hypothetical protein